MLDKAFKIDAICTWCGDLEKLLGIELGFDTFKFFPNEMIGGMRYLKRVHAPTHIKTIYTVLWPFRKAYPEYTAEILS